MLLVFVFYVYRSFKLSEWCGMQPHLKVKKVEFSQKKSLTLSDTLNLVHYGRSCHCQPLTHLSCFLSFVFLCLCQLLPDFCQERDAQSLSAVWRPNRCRAEQDCLPELAYTRPLWANYRLKHPWYLLFTSSENVTINLWSIYDNKEAEVWLKWRH